MYNNKRKPKNDKTKVYIGLVIKDARGKKKITQAELGARTELSRSFICDIENGRYMPSTLNLLKICKVLEIDLNRISL